MGFKTNILAGAAGFLGGSQAENDVRKLASQFSGRAPSPIPASNAPASAPPLPRWSNLSPGHQRNRFELAQGRVHGRPVQNTYQGPGGNPNPSTAFGYFPPPPPLPSQPPAQHGPAFQADPNPFSHQAASQHDPRGAAPSVMPQHPSYDADTMRLYDSAIRSGAARAQFEQGSREFHDCLARIDVQLPAQAIPLFNEVKGRLDALSEINKQAGSSRVDRNAYEALEHHALQKYNAFMELHQGQAASSVHNLGFTSIPPAPPQQLYDSHIARAAQLPEAELQAYVVAPLNSLLMDSQFKLNERFHQLAQVLSSPNFSLDIKAAIMNHVNTFLDNPANRGAGSSSSGPKAGPSARIAAGLTAQLASGSPMHPGLVEHIMSTLAKCSPAGPFVNGEQASVNAAIANLSAHGQHREAQALAAIWSPAMRADRERAERMYAIFHN